MSVFITNPIFLTSLAAGCAGVLLLVQARMQSRMLRQRIASGAGTVVMDAATGLFSSAAAWQCVRGEANRAARLKRPLEVWVATAPDDETIDSLGRALAFELPSGATGIRIDERHVCLVTCVAEARPEHGALAELDWSHGTFEPSEHSAQAAHEFIAEATNG